MSKINEFPIEPHALLLTQLPPDQILYKIIEKRHFEDMRKNSYIYFNRVDTYTDDMFDGDQLPKDRVHNEAIKFSNNEHSASNYYDNARSRSYACCLSLEYSEHMRNKYGGENPVSRKFRFGDLRKELNATIQYCQLRNDCHVVPNPFYINYGKVKYISRDQCQSRKGPPNPIEYLYMKHKNYEPEAEVRITLSAIGIGNFKMANGDDLAFLKSLKFEFNWKEAIDQGWVEVI